MDFGWWRLPRSRAAWRLSWDVDDHRLRLYEGGSEAFVLRLGTFATEAEARAAIGDWTDAPVVEGTFGRDGRWLAERFPSAAGLIVGEDRP